MIHNTLLLRRLRNAECNTWGNFQSGFSTILPQKDRQVCQRHNNIPLLLLLGAFVESVRSPHKNNPPKARSCVCAGGLPSAPQNKQQHMKRKASLQLCMCSNEGACSVGSFACICIDTELILHCWSSKTAVVMFSFHVTSRGMQI